MSIVVIRFPSQMLRLTSAYCTNWLQFIPCFSYVFLFLYLKQVWYCFLSFLKLKWNNFINHYYFSLSMGTCHVALHWLGTHNVVRFRFQTIFILWYLFWHFATFSTTCFWYKWQGCPKIIKFSYKMFLIQVTKIYWEK